MSDEAEYWAKVRKVTLEHATRVGEVTLAWVYLHVTLGLWYTRLNSSGSDITHALRDWDVCNSDYHQRNAMLVPSIKASRNKNAAIMDSLLWVCEWANELARIRNGFVHAITVVRGLPDKPQVEFMEQLHLKGADDRFARVKGKLPESFDALMTDLGALSEFIHRSFNVFVLPDKFGPPPERPALAILKLFPDIRPKPL